MESTLYVGDLPDTANPQDLTAFFSGFPMSPPVLHKNGKGETYAVITVDSKQIAQAIIDKYNYTELLGREIRICNFVPKLKREMEGNLFIKVPRELKMRAIYSALKIYGDILNLKLNHMPDGTSRGYGYVQFAKKDNADKALDDVYN